MLTYVVILITFQILQAGEDINQINNCGFRTDSPTVHVSNIGGVKYIVQVRFISYEIRFCSTLIEIFSLLYYLSSGS
jgi:hypothetical protein